MAHPCDAEEHFLSELSEGHRWAPPGSLGDEVTNPSSAAAMELHRHGFSSRPLLHPKHLQVGARRQHFLHVTGARAEFVNCSPAAEDEPPTLYRLSSGNSVDPAPLGLREFHQHSEPSPSILGYYLDTGRDANRADCLALLNGPWSLLRGTAGAAGWDIDAAFERSFSGTPAAQLTLENLVGQQAWIAKRPLTWTEFQDAHEEWERAFPPAERTLALAQSIAMFMSELSAQLFQMEPQVLEHVGSLADLRLIHKSKGLSVSLYDLSLAAVSDVSVQVLTAAVKLLSASEMTVRWTADSNTTTFTQHTRKARCWLQAELSTGAFAMASPLLASPSLGWRRQKGVRCCCTGS